jgi:uncharacterized membrane protein
MLVVTLYSKKDCSICGEAREMLLKINEQIPHQLVELDIESDPSLQEKVGESIPVLQIGPYVLKWPFTEQEIRVSLGAASDRQQYYEQVGDHRYRDRIKRGRSISGTDRFSYWLSTKYMWIISVLLFIYVGLPFLAPVLMHFNIQGPAKVIYSVYSPLCHQLGFRSVFLFGEQTVYPRALAHVPGLITYEEITHQDEVDVLAARKYLGNAVVGYKTALCQRDLAIYGSLFLFSFLFIVTGRKIKPIPWYLWVFVGLVPIAIDGLSQLPGIAANLMPSWLPVRESIPALRYLTGALFGFTTGWYLFPMLEETMRETARMLSRKFSIVKQLEESGETAVIDG